MRIVITVDQSTHGILGHLECRMGIPSGILNHRRICPQKTIQVIRILQVVPAQDHLFAPYRGRPVHFGLLGLLCLPCLFGLLALLVLPGLFDLLWRRSENCRSDSLQGRCRLNHHRIHILEVVILMLRHTREGLSYLNA